MNIRLTTYTKAENIPPLPGTNASHSTELFRVLEQTPGYVPMLIVAYRGDSPVAKLLCVSRRGGFGLLKWRHCLVYGEGDYLGVEGKKREEIFEQMFSHLVFQQREKAFLMEVRHLSHTLFGYRIFRKNGFFPIKWMRIRNSIDRERIDKWMSASRKKQITGGLKSGATMEVVRNEAEVVELAALLKRFYASRARQHFPDVRFFVLYYRYVVAGGGGDIFIVRYKNRIIGGSVSFYTPHTACLLFSGGLNKTCHAQYPEALAVWKAMLHAKEKGKSTFEFVNAGMPFRKYGFRNFLLRFGGQQSTIRRWYSCRWKWLNRLLTYIYV